MEAVRGGHLEVADELLRQLPDGGAAQATRVDADGRGLLSLACDSDRARKDEAMLANAASQRDRAEDHRQRQPDLMDDRLAQQPAGRSHQREQNRGRDAMHRAQARKAHRQPVEPGGLYWSRCHDGRRYR